MRKTTTVRRAAIWIARSGRHNDWQEKYAQEYADDETNYRGKVSGDVYRIYGEANGLNGIIEADENFRGDVVSSSVCGDCEFKLGALMDIDCKIKFIKDIRMHRSGQVSGGACGALYARGFVGSVATMSAAGGVCGGLSGEPRGGVGCGGSLCKAAMCGGGCDVGAAGAGAIGGGGCGGGCGGGGCGGC